jgi:preprotein translocase subunit YajC
LKKRQEMLSAVRRGDTVVTGGGFIGKVTKVIDDNELEIDLGGAKVTALRSTISEVRVKGEPVANQNAKK